MSDETRKKISLAKLGKPSGAKGKHWKLGRPAILSDSERKRRSEAMKNIKNPHHLKPDEKHYRWKGDKVGYHALHHWINKKLGHPLVCEHCGQSGKRLEWANIDHKYRRVLEDWIRLCKSCHCKYDLNINKNARTLS